ncbi:MAG TPA: lysophospholipid acyltransferase family protein [Acidimicrobiia bacterium]
MDAAYGLARALLLPPLSYGFDWTVQGAASIPSSGPVILASNHVSYLDPLALGYLGNLRRRRLRFLAKAELFDKAGLGSFLRSARQIPVSRGTSDAASSLDGGLAALQQGECLAVFPEGTISLDLEPMAGKSGTARLAIMSGAPVVPVGLWGAQRIMFKGRKPRWRWGVAEVAVVGEPLRFAADDDVRDATDRIMAAICAAVAQARAIYPQQSSEGEGDWWVREPETAQLRSCRTA